MIYIVIKSSGIINFYFREKSTYCKSFFFGEWKNTF